MDEVSSVTHLSAMVCEAGFPASPRVNESGRSRRRCCRGRRRAAGAEPAANRDALALRLRGGAVVADRSIATGPVHVLMGIRAILLRLHLMPCSIVVPSPMMGHGRRSRQKCC